jgi:hypothetical protein
MFEASAVYCSPSTGNLLISCDGNRVYNGSGQLMRNGDELIGNSSSAQGATIIPWPCDSNRFLVVTTDQGGYGGPSKGAFYHVIDLLGDRGNGEVIVKNAPLNSAVGEAAVVAPMSQGTGFWVILHSLSGNTFYAHAFNHSGITTNAITSTVGTMLTPVPRRGDISKMAVSGDATKLAMSVVYQNLLELFRFDPNNGKLYEPRNILGPSVDRVNMEGPYGICFSPDDRLLYFSVNYVYYYKNSVYQTAVDNIDQSYLDKNTFLVTDTTVHYTNKAFGSIELGPNGLLYFPTSDITLGTISHPDVRGVGCQANDRAITVNKQFIRPSLPNNIRGLHTSRAPAPVFVVDQQFIIGDEEEAAIVFSPTENVSVINVTGSAQPGAITLSNLVFGEIYADGRFDISIITDGDTKRFLLPLSLLTDCEQVQIKSISLDGSADCNFVTQFFSFCKPCEIDVIRQSMISERSVEINVDPNFIRIESMSDIDWVVIDNLGRSISNGSKSTIRIDTFPTGAYYIVVSSFGSVFTKQFLVVP